MYRRGQGDCPGVGSRGSVPRHGRLAEPAVSCRSRRNATAMTDRRDDGDLVWRVLNAIAVLVGLLLVGTVVVVVVTSI